MSICPRSGGGYVERVFLGWANDMKFLINALKDEDAFVRYRAEKTLGEIE